MYQKLTNEICTFAFVMTRMIKALKLSAAIVLAVSAISSCTTDTDSEMNKFVDNLYENMNSLAICGTSRIINYFSFNFHFASF